MGNIENTGNSAGDTAHETLHLHVIDHEADKAFQERFSEDLFLGTRMGIKHMVIADKETRKFDRLTLDARMNPVVNHNRDAYEYDTGPE